MTDFGVLHGSTKQLMSLIDKLPKADQPNAKLLPTKQQRSGRKKQQISRFSNHPRKFDSHSSTSSTKSSKSLLVLKTPAGNHRSSLTDSSDEYCDITVRKDDLELINSEQRPVSDHILDAVEANRLDESKLERFNSTPCRNRGEGEKVEAKVVAVKEVKRETPKQRMSKVTRGGVHERHTVCEEAREEAVAPKIFMSKKAQKVIQESLQMIEEIRLTMETGIEEPDGAEDLERRRKRSAEFINRFSRVHLYTINNQSKELESLLTPSSNHRADPIEVNQKFLVLNNSILQACRAYSKHLPSSAIVGTPEKLKDLLRSACALCSSFRDNVADPSNNDNSVMDVLEIRCKTLLDSIDEQYFADSRVSVLASSGNSIKLANAKNTKQIKSKAKKLSMYNTVPIRRDVFWKKAIAVLAQKRFNVPSRYKTATFKHRPQPGTEETEQPEEMVTRRMKPKDTTSMSYSRRSRYKDFDNIETMLQFEDKRQQDDAVEEQPSRRADNIMWNLAQGFFNKISKENKNMTETEYECILEHLISIIKKNEDPKAIHNKHRPLGDIEQETKQLLEEKLEAPIESMNFLEFVDKLLGCMNTGKEAHREVQSPEVKEQCECVSSPEVPVQVEVPISIKKSSVQTLSITGDKNAQLICMKDDGSVKEPSDADDEADATVQKQKSSTDAMQKSSDELIYLENDAEERYLSGSKAPKLARLRPNTPNLRRLEMLPKDLIIGIIEYKLEFHKATRDNYMYRKAGERSPWLIMERIADKLMDECLHSIARDIQVDQILHKIYTQEFK